MEERIKVWVTGAGGLIGSHLVNIPVAQGSRYQPIALTRARLDLTDFASVERQFREDQPGAVIHCAALTNNPACEKDPELAWHLNVEVTRHLARLASSIPFIFFSTDLVFDGKQGNYRETDIPRPLSVYGETKLAAEKIVLENPLHSVIRTSLNGGNSPTGDRGFDEQLRRAWERGQTLRLFTDEFRSPIHASVTARAVWELLAADEPGLYHVCGSERLSRWEIGRLIADRHPELRPRLHPGSLKEYRGAPRSPDTTLNCQKAQSILSFQLPAFTSWLKEHASEKSYAS